MEGGHGGRRALSDQIRTRDSSNNLGNLIKVREEDGNAPVAPNRTLLDIIREEEPGHRLAAGGHKIKWKSFKDRIRLRRSGTAWSSSSGHGHGHSVSPPIYHPPPPDVAEEPAGDEPPTPESPGPARVSLMSLLETDRYSGPLGGSSDGEVEYEEESGEEEEENEEEGVEFVCCVCMVRHKGAAFIPCGHTFCRLCSRELWVDRGNCPLCNGYILEILDIF